MFNIQKNRHLRIAYQLINKGDFVTSEELAALTDLSPRTIKSEMSFIADLFRENGAELIGKKSDGYSYSIMDEVKFESFKRRLNLLFFYYDNLTDLNSYLQIVHILRTVLAGTSPVSVEMLANEMGTNRRGIKQELSVVRKLFQDYHMHMRSSNGCISLDQNEKWMRFCCVASFGITYHQFEKRLPQEAFAELFACNEIQFQNVRDQFLKVLNRNEVHISDSRVQDFARYLVLTCNRTYMGKSIELDNEERTLAKQLKLYPVAEEIATILEEGFSVTLSCDEICVIAEYLSSYRDLDIKDVNPDAIGDVYEQAIKTNEILESYLAQRWNIPVHESTKNCFLPICASFGLRDQFGFLSNKDLLIDTSKTAISASPMALEIGEDIIRCLYDIYGCYGTANDLYECAQLAYCRLHDIDYPQKKLRVAVVSGHGRVNAQMIKDYLDRYFGSYIEQIRTCELYELRDISPQDLDAVVGSYPHCVYNYSIPLINFEQDKGLTNLSTIWNSLFYRAIQLDGVAQKIADVLTVEKDVVISSVDEACEEFAMKHGADVELARRAATHTENYNAQFICASAPTQCKIFNLNVQRFGNEVVEIKQLKNPIALKGGNKISALLFIALDYAKDPSLLRGMTNLLEVFRRNEFNFDRLNTQSESELKDYIKELLVQEVRMF